MSDQLLDDLSKEWPLPPEGYAEKVMPKRTFSDTKCQYIAVRKGCEMCLK
jgi:hypothetical protein